MISLLIVLVLLGLALWVVEQLPLDPTIVRIIRVVAIVAAVLYVLSALTGRHFLPGL
jgi:uncharacterized membrane protein YvlD (DUF360 family)